MKFLNIFRKTIEEPEKPIDEQPLVLASVTYTIDKTGEMFVDISMEDMGEGSIDGLSTLMSTLPTVKCQLITLDMIKSAFAEEGNFEEYIKLITDITQKTEIRTREIEASSDNKEPYIKPSDML